MVFRISQDLQEDPKNNNSPINATKPLIAANHEWTRSAVQYSELFSLWSINLAIE